MYAENAAVRRTGAFFCRNDDGFGLSKFYPDGFLGYFFQNLTATVSLCVLCTSAPLREPF